MVGYWWYWLCSGGGCSGRVLKRCDFSGGADGFCRVVFVIVVGVLQLSTCCVVALVA